MIAWNRKTGECIQTASVIGTSDTDLSHFPSDVPQASAAFLDPSIEYLRQEVEGCGRCIRLKFHGRNEIFLNNPSELGSFLSSGTIRGMILFSMAHRILSTGGCMAVDDLERSLNAEVAKTLVRLFEDGRINRKGGTLIFSAHSPEMLDEFDRRD
nr:ATP-binding protein [Succinivibrionaceae bacterium]